jgi:ABC-type nitrate/sulfonate/bicarbonate transport system substrate-binding protein
MTCVRARARSFWLPAVAAVLVACADAGTPTVTGETVAGSTTSTAPSTTLAAPVNDIGAGAAMPADRCDANRAAGELRFATGDGYVLTAPSVQVMLAEARGYFDELCLNVTVQPSDTTQNYALAAGVEVSFAAGASLGELTGYAGRNDAGLIAVAVDGASSLDGLVVPDQVQSLADLLPADGDTPLRIGAYGSLPVSVLTMLDGQGVPTDSIEFVPLDDQIFDEVITGVGTELDAIVGRLDDEVLTGTTISDLGLADLGLTVWAADDEDVPGTFGVLVTTRTFMALHPSAAEDFLRASQRALIDARNNPDDALDDIESWLTSLDQPVELDRDLERRRLQLVLGAPLDVPDRLDITELSDEIDDAVAAGAYAKPVLPLADLVDDSLLDTIYAADGSVIWPER